MKIWLCLITNDKEALNIEALTSVWENFDGIAAVVHPQGGDGKVREILEARKKDGFVIERPYVYHNGHSMNEWLFDRRIELGDYCFIRDSSERFTPVFAANIRPFVSSLERQGIWNVFNTSKLLMFRRWFNQQFINGLHWGLMGLHGTSIQLDKIDEFRQDGHEYAFSVRNEQRPFDHRYMHEVRYLIEYGANGNHLQLYHNDPGELDRHQREFIGLLFHLKELHIKTTEQFRDFLQNCPLDDRMKHPLNQERPLRNFYRYYVLQHKHEDILVDENTWRIA